MSATIKISCPVCGSVLAVKDSPDNEFRELTCPVCKKKSPYTSYRKIGANAGEHTEYPDSPLRQNEKDNAAIGKILVVDKGLAFQLKEGLNIIGRQSKSSNADIQLPCSSRRMSREHVVIEVRQVPGKGYVHYISLNKQQVNPTYIGSEPLMYGDKIILNEGDIIRLPDMTVRFVLPDIDKD